ncbi:isoprenoid synthase domain-containing protein [Lanmaoa asiatica]|nr:isoprenoid synthase domain-containing protein [Lanmaoa asiatica]
MHANHPYSLMTTEAYRLPDLLALLPKKSGGEINPHFKEVEAAFNAWVAKNLRGPCAVEVDQSDSLLFVAMVYPLASQLQLKGITNYTAAAFFDRSPSKDSPALSQLWMKTLVDGNEGKIVQHPLAEMMHIELLVTLRPVVGTFHWPQCTAEIEMMVKGMHRETHEREVCQNKDANPDIQSYVMKRRLNIGAGPCFVFLRSTRCLYIPNDILANPVVLDMQNTTTQMLLIANDIYSFKREYAFDGAFTNLLTVMQNDPETTHLDFQGRLDYAEKLFKAALDCFQACRREIPSFGPEMDQYLAMYADGLIDMVIGNLQWSRVTRRYSAFANDEDRRNNIMRLALCGSPANESDVPVR